MPSGTRYGYVTKGFEIQVITPMIGGGVEPARADDEIPVRASSVRGHLRFWWRATIGARLPTLADMHRREGEIWGSTSSASRIRILVKAHNFGEANSNHWRWPSSKKDRDKVFSYILFPFEPSIPPPRVGSFSLEVTYPTELKDDLCTALWAWTNFGGIGARLRRGFGALFCERFAPDTPEKSRLDQWFKDARRLFETPPMIKEIPCLVSGPLVLRPGRDAIPAWRRTVELLKRFRQEDVGRKARPTGRSYWPEPETLRDIQGQRVKNKYQPAYPRNAFPRAELGLPIGFKFKDAGDPGPSELYPEGAKRMASPLILRPLAFGDGNEALPMVLRLEAPGPQGLQLKFKDKEGKPVIRDLPAGLKSVRRQAFTNYSTNSPMGKGRSTSGSALEAFIAFAKEGGFQEVGA
jgi:CRISPR-associated protein Cmr1